jgi:hypothetical protein
VYNESRMLIGLYNLGINDSSTYTSFNKVVA